MDKKYALSMEDLDQVVGGAEEGSDESRRKGVFCTKTGCGKVLRETRYGYICSCGAQYNQYMERIDSGVL